MAPPPTPMLPMADPAGRRVGKYLVGEPLGEGGMGKVYKALDTTLGRTVALKLVTTGGSDAFVRLLLEAQALARLEHPHICHIHEVGEWEGRPFIAMQYVEGSTLREAAKDLSWREAVCLMRAVALAIHAAHRLGLVHRDLKPANIMVTRDEWGALQPVVLDFGLVRDLAAPGLTLTGMPMGTPAFMSPEQAEGESARVDRRSDVFSLGATLYAILLGRPPFEGSRPMDTLRRVVESEPDAPRSLDSNLPLDLETVILTCLAKEPARRYDTALALAEDLRRVLEDEPISARRASHLQRWGRQARRHPAVAASLAVVVGLLGVLGLLLVRQRIVLERSTQVATQVGAVAREVEHRMRMAYLLPPHSLIAEKAVVRTRMAEVRTLMAGLPEASTGAAHHALGRGHMALGEWGPARVALERAWALGYRVPEAALSLGIVKAELYQRRLRTVSQLKDPGQKTTALRALEKELRNPALSHLRAGKSASPSPATVEAQVLALQGDTDGALRQVEVALHQTPAAYEASLLAGVLHQQRYLDAIAVRNWPAAEVEEGRVRAAYEAAGEVGRSDPRAREGVACLLIFVHNDRGVYRDQDVDHLLEEVDSLTGPLLALDPESARGHCCQSYVLWRRGRGAADNEKAIAEARLATRFDPEDDYGWVLLAATLSRAVDYAWETGLDPEPAIEESTAACETLLRLVPKGSHHGLIATEKLAKARLRRYQHRAESGTLQPGDETATRAALEEALFADPQYQYFEQMLGWFHLHTAWHAILEGRDPEPSWEALLALSRRTHAAATFAGRRLDLRMWALLARTDHLLRTGRAEVAPWRDLEAGLVAGQALWPSAKHDLYAAKVALLQARRTGEAAREGWLRRAEAHARALAARRDGKGVAAWRLQVAPLAVEIALVRMDKRALKSDLTPRLRRALQVAPTPDLEFERPGTQALVRASLEARLNPEPVKEQVLQRLTQRNRLLGPLLPSAVW